MTTESVPKSAPRTSGLRRHGGKVLLSLIVAVSFGWLLHKGGLPLAPGKEAFARVRWWTLLAYVGVFAVVTVLRAVRWHFLLAPIAKVPMRRLLSVSFLGFAAITLFPFRTGEAVRPLLIRQRGALSGWAATGTIAAERIIDGLVLTLLLFAGLTLSTPLSPIPDRIGDLPISPAMVPRAAYVALGVFGAAFTVMGVFYAQRVWARRMTEKIVGVVSPRLATWLADTVEHVAAGLRFLPNVRYSAPFIAITVAYWFLNAAGVWLVAWGSGFDDFTLLQACVAIGVVALGISVPNAPGFFGAYQLSFYAALAVYYPPKMVIGPGAACVLLVYSTQLAMMILTAGIGALMDRETLRGALADAPAENSAENLAAPPRAG